MTLMRPRRGAGTRVAALPACDSDSGPVSANWGLKIHMEVSECPIWSLHVAHTQNTFAFRQHADHM